jgi:hypothetical protein
LRPLLLGLVNHDVEKLARQQAKLAISHSQTNSIIGLAELLKLCPGFLGRAFFCRGGFRHSRLEVMVKKLAAFFSP